MHSIIGELEGEHPSPATEAPAISLLFLSSRFCALVSMLQMHKLFVSVWGASYVGEHVFLPSWSSLGCIHANEIGGASWRVVLELSTIGVVRFN